MIEQLWSGLIEFSSHIVVPDWGALVGLIPIGLALLVGLYLTWVVYRLATAGPTRRGKRRLPPAAPAGVHMPGPSFAPLLAAVGAFFLIFGVVAGGVWLVVGGLILAITLLYWGREEMRNFDRGVASGSGPGVGPGVTAGALRAPAGTPPAGVHMPPPSFRPLLIAVAATIFVAGLVVGGAALVLGAVALVIVLLGWLWDARREYAATVAADRTGHLDLGGAPTWPKATFAVLALLVAAALLFSSGVLDRSTGGTATASAAPGAGGGTAGASAPAASLPTADATITAANIDFTTKAVTVPAGKAFTLAFDNQDAGVLHDVVITDAGGAQVFKGELVTGAAVVVYDVPAIPAGQYTFACSVHPTMKGTVTAQ